jgi:hypothetical protein
MLKLYWYFEHLTLNFVLSGSADDASSREYLSKCYIVLCVICAADVSTVSVVGISATFNEAVHMFDFVALMVQ